LPAVVNGPGDEAWLTRSPDGRVILFGRHQPDYSAHHIYMTRLVDGSWTDPVEAPFTRGRQATAPHFAPDGRSVLFIATWAPDGQPREGAAREGNVWRVTWDGATWGEPHMLPAPINSPATEIDAVEVNGGVIYFTSMRAGGVGPQPEHTSGNAANRAYPDMYRAIPDGRGGYRVEPLADFNTERTESTLYVTPDESLILFHRADDPRGVGEDDLFAARRQGSGWGPEIHLGADVNSADYEYGPEVSADGSTLYFTTHRGEQAGIMAVNLRAALGD
jgi:Tol biopolymer transport system component